MTVQDPWLSSFLPATCPLQTDLSTAQPNTMTTPVVNLRLRMQPAWSTSQECGNSVTGRCIGRSWTTRGNAGKHLPAHLNIINIINCLSVGFAIPFACSPTTMQITSVMADVSNPQCQEKGTAWFLPCSTVHHPFPHVPNVSLVN